MNISEFCTCKNLKCPLHPTGHDQGCAPCIEKNLKVKGMPNCFFNTLENGEDRTADKFEDFAKLVLKKPVREPEQMKQGRIVLITGAPGTGKTTVSALVAKESDMEKSVHMHTDDFYHYLSKGVIAPHLPESNEQNLIVIEAFLEAAKRYVRGGYDVIVDGIIGPWFLTPWLAIARDGYEVHYIILRASKEETMKRAVGRAKLEKDLNVELVETMWEQFHHLESYESNVVDTTNDSIQETALIVKRIISNKTLVLL